MSDSEVVHVANEDSTFDRKDFEEFNWGQHLVVPLPRSSFGIIILSLPHIRCIYVGAMDN
ncbi:hypothetical protein VNI00_016937 [Paramarasmius palmivorus]|uniref:Uncharacterized protein n=1 Tax=Paramarasmius palmivorus TaxID=297713 RepID=A0AAW0B9W0_9AGAR